MKSFLINFASIYFVIAFGIFCFFSFFAIVLWKDVKRDIYSEPIKVFNMIFLTSVFWIFFAETIIKGLFQKVE